MQRLLKKKELVIILLFSIYFTAGLILHLIPFTREYVLIITDLSMLLTNTIVFYHVFKTTRNNKLIIWSIGAFIVTFLVELAGTKTGLIFGEYHYGATMLVKVFDVPLVIGMNWVILILASYSLVQLTGINRYIIPFISSLLIVGFDYIMEEVAMKLDYWKWEGGIIPIQNYIAWFCISLIFSSLLSLLKVYIQSRILQLYFIIQLIFFIFLRVLLI
jgi:putative membrane protein